MTIETTKKWFLKYSAIWGYIVTVLGVIEVTLAPLAPLYPRVGTALVIIGAIQVGVAAINQHIDEYRDSQKKAKQL